MKSFAYLFNRYLRGVHYVPGIAEVLVNRTDEFLLLEFIFQWGQPCRGQAEAIRLRRKYTGDVVKGDCWDRGGGQLGMSSTRRSHQSCSLSDGNLCPRAGDQGTRQMGRQGQRSCGDSLGTF